MDTFYVNPGATIPEPLPTLFAAESPLTSASVHCPGHGDNGTISPWNLTPSIHQCSVIKMFHGDPKL